MSDTAPVNNIPVLEDGEYHAFISHKFCDKDTDYALGLKKTLEAKGFRCFHSEDDFMPGDSIIKNIEFGISKSRRVIVIVSKEMMDSKYVHFEITNSKIKAGQSKEVTLIPILFNITADNIPAYLREINYLQHDEEKFLPKLVRSLTESIPLSASIPAGDIAYGLAWSYYYGYLSFVLPKLADRAKSSEKYGKKPNFLPKMVILLPETCRCPANLSEVDHNVTHDGIISFKADRAGKEGRPYDSSVFKITDPGNGEQFYTIMEYATPLMAMYEMEQGRRASLDQSAKYHQMLLFKKYVEDILSHPSDTRIHDTAVMVSYKDQSSSGDQDELATVLARLIRDELQRPSLVSPAPTNTEEPMTL